MQSNDWIADAWPVVLDEFVEQLKASRAAAATK